MTQPLQVTKTLSIVPLVTFQSSDFPTWYSHGVWWSQHGREGHGSLEDTYIPDCLVRGIERRAYTNPTDRNLARDVAFWLGMIHGGVVTDSGVLQQDITTLVRLQDTDCLHGYRVGRQFFFTEADTPEDWMFTETRLLASIYDVLDDYQYSPNTRDIRYALGDLLGHLSGQIFPWTTEEQDAFDEEHMRLCGHVAHLDPRCLAMQQRTLYVVS
jgi:hypothetical protein